jgi:hypothetical protein
MTKRFAKSFTRTAAGRVVRTAVSGDSVGSEGGLVAACESSLLSFEDSMRVRIVLARSPFFTAQITDRAAPEFPMGAIALFA